jgi:peptidoglycan-associated lipoprotein
MKRSNGFGAAILLCLAAGACSHHQTIVTTPKVTPPVISKTTTPPKKIEPPPVKVQPPTVPALAGKTIYFDFDQALLSDASRQTLNDLWTVFSQHAGAALKVAGNCDERGTEEYNLALGQARADAAKQYLQMLGAKGGSVTTVSYGEDKPAALGHDETSWSKNRRDDIDPVQ